MSIFAKFPPKLPLTGCDLMLYRYNKKEGVNNLRPCHIEQLPISNKSVHKVRDYVCDYFDVHKREDRNLIESFFIGRPIDCFEFERNDSNLVYGVSALGKDPEFATLKHEFNPESLKIQDSNCLLVKVEMLFDGLEEELSFEKSRVIHGIDQIKTYLSRDPWATALFQSHSFKCLRQYNIDIRASRSIEKIDLMNAKFGRTL